MLISIENCEKCVRACRKMAKIFSLFCNQCFLSPFRSLQYVIFASVICMTFAYPGFDYHHGGHEVHAYEGGFGGEGGESDYGHHIASQRIGHDHEHAHEFHHEEDEHVDYYVSLFLPIYWQSIVHFLFNWFAFYGVVCVHISSRTHNIRD